MRYLIACFIPVLLLAAACGPRIVKPYITNHHMEIIYAGDHSSVGQLTSDAGVRKNIFIVWGRTGKHAQDTIDTELCRKPKKICTVTPNGVVFVVTYPDPE